MNFTEEIKRDLLRKTPSARCCRLALMAAAVDTSGEWRRKDPGGIPREGISFTSESESIAEYLLRIPEKCFGIPLTLTAAALDPKNKKNKLTFSYFGERGKELAEEISASRPFFTGRACCGEAYLKGAFLCGGSCTLPREGSKTGYHLEFVFSSAERAEEFCELLDRMQLVGSMVTRGDRYVVYNKNREGISDFLSVAGARSALMRFEDVTSARELNNNENRVENCMAGNADRSATASVAQTVALGVLKERGILQGLPEPLRMVAEARLSHPTYSLNELADLLGIGKSCLNHRMRKLMRLYSEKTDGTT